MDTPKLVRRAYVAEQERAEDGTLTVVISTGGVDRFNTVLDPSGWDLTNYKKNPVVMWAHQREQLPIARCMKVWLDGSKLKATIDWSDAIRINPFAAQVKQYYDAGLLSGWSVGFIPTETEYPDQSFGKDAESARKPITFRKMELVEFSAAPIPANPDALTSKGLGETLSRAIAQGLNFNDATREQMELAAFTKSPLVNDWLTRTYESRIGAAAPDEKPEPGVDDDDDERGLDLIETRDWAEWDASRVPAGKGLHSNVHLVSGFSSKDAKKYRDDMKAKGYGAMHVSWGDKGPRGNGVLIFHKGSHSRALEAEQRTDGPCCGDIDEADLREDGGYLMPGDQAEAFVARVMEVLETRDDDPCDVYQPGSLQWKKCKGKRLLDLLTNRENGRKAPADMPADGKEREKTPSHVYLDPANKKYPYKRQKNGAWVISCKDLHDAVSVANGQKDTGIARKASALIAKHCAKKSWDVVGARRRVAAWAGADRARFAKACAVRDLLCHHDVQYGHLVTVVAGVRNAMVLLLCMTDEYRASEEGQAAYAHLAAHYREFGLRLPATPLVEQRDWAEWDANRVSAMHSSTAVTAYSPKNELAINKIADGLTKVTGFDSREHAVRFGAAASKGGYGVKRLESGTTKYGSGHAVVLQHKK